jgi:isopentenyl-diphosphate delta-isomerase
MRVDSMSDLSSRKADHIDLCATGDVGFRDKTTLLSCVELLHDALPEMSLDDVDLGATVLGKRLRAPILIAAMTGGTERAREINQGLAEIAEERGYAFGLGSQRAMLRGGVDTTYDVRKQAPTTLVLGNLGGVQARDISSEEVADLALRVGADAMCIHLNPAMELVQPGGDRDFTGIVAAIERLSRDLPIPVIAKETGCGLAPRALQRLVSAGIEHVDVSGSGGTSWVAVETARAEGASRSLGEALREWGVPTAASVVYARAARPKLSTIFATGGVATGLDAARALALGATAVGVARPALQAFLSGGKEAAVALLAGIESELRAVMLLSGCARVKDLKKADRVYTGELTAWLR